MRPRHYILDAERQPVPCGAETWARWFTSASQDGSRIVAKTRRETWVVSTVFLGLDHNWFEHGPAVLFETMIFGGDNWDEEYCERCSTWDMAELQHERAVRYVDQMIAAARLPQSED